MSQEKLAAAAVTSKQTIIRLEKGPPDGMKFTVEWARRLAPHLRYSPEQLMFWKPEFADPVQPDQHIDSMDVLPREPDGDSPLTEDNKPFPDALPQMVGRMGGGSTGAVITIDVGAMQTREEVGEWWRIPPAVLRGLARADSSRTVGFAMDGDSMEPTIQRTDIVFIDTSRQKIEPDGIWAIDYGLGRTLKRISVRRAEDGVRFIIKSDNKSYPDEEYSPGEVTIFGRYVGRFSVF